MSRTPSQATLRPSYPYAFKSRFYVEHEWTDATIKVDYDTHRNPFSIARVVRAFRSNAVKLDLRRNHVELARLMVFSTGRGHHLRAWLSYASAFDASIFGACLAVTPTFPARATLRIQAALGDDPMRQKFNAARVRRGEAGFNVLFNEKYRNGHLLSQEVYDLETSRELETRLGLRLP